MRFFKIFMEKQIVILFASYLMLSACDGYHDSLKSDGAVENLNNKLEAGRLNNENWTNSPEGIIRHLFPAVSHDNGRNRYEVTKRSTSDETCSVTVLEEGPTDDEVLGERRTIEFQKTSGKWNIISYRYAAKSRD